MQAGGRDWALPAFLSPAEQKPKSVRLYRHSEKSPLIQQGFFRQFCCTGQGAAGIRAATHRCCGHCCKSDSPCSNVGMSLTSMQHPKMGWRSINVLVASQQAAKAAHPELGQARESTQLKTRDAGLVPLLCHSLPRVPGDSCWV